VSSVLPARRAVWERCRPSRPSVRAACARDDDGESLPDIGGDRGEPLITDQREHPLCTREKRCIGGLAVTGPGLRVVVACDSRAPGALGGGEQLLLALTCDVVIPDGELARCRTRRSLKPSYASEALSQAERDALNSDAEVFLETGRVAAFALLASRSWRSRRSG
jgi:hypothetical protein